MLVFPRIYLWSISNWNLNENVHDWRIESAFFELCRRALRIFLGLKLRLRKKKLGFGLTKVNFVVSFTNTLLRTYVVLFMGSSAIHCLSSTLFFSIHCARNFNCQKISGVPRFEPGTAGWEAQTLPLCYVVPPKDFDMMWISKVTKTFRASFLLLSHL